LSAGLSGLTYVSITPGSFYEAGTLVALGTAFALWRMQGGWHDATKQVEGELYDEGRNVIRRITARMQQLVEEKVQPRVNQAEQERWQLAIDSVKKEQTELQQLLEHDRVRGSK